MNSASAESLIILSFGVFSTPIDANVAAHRKKLE